MNFLIGRSVKAKFNAKVLNTFGKLDDKEIEDIDGQSERLLVALLENYKWDTDVARERVAQFNLELNNKNSGNRHPAMEEIGSIALEKTDMGTISKPMVATRKEAV